MKTCNKLVDLEKTTDECLRLMLKGVQTNKEKKDSGFKVASYELDKDLKTLPENFDYYLLV